MPTYAVLYSMLDASGRLQAYAAQFVRDTREDAIVAAMQLYDNKPAFKVLACREMKP